MKKLSKLTVITTILTLLPIVLGAALYSRLPDTVVTHWGFNNEPNGWSPKWMACFGIPLIMAAINFVLSVVADKEETAVKTSNTAMNIARWTVPVLSMLLVPMMLFSALGVPFDVEKIASAIVSLLLIVIGNYLPKCRRNKYVGIRLPWTLKSDENWDKTHRLSGYVWMLGGLIMVIVTWIGRPQITLIVLLAIILIPTVYSFILHRRGV
ncbi:MAG: SdpI family protein [Clostridia bacterium]|nr:SdpI family protein [Clostridia bacterium]